MLDLPEQISSKIQPEPNSGCWLWDANGNDRDYGYVQWKGKNRRAHRVVYSLLREEIPEGLSIDHTCNVRCCVNPDHLEAVTHAENMRRAAEKKTHCFHGHDFTSENTYVRKDGTMHCRICKSRRSKAYYERQKALKSV